MNDDDDGRPICSIQVMIYATVNRSQLEKTGYSLETG